MMDAKIETHDVSVTENAFFRRDAMNDFLVHRDANAARKPVVPLERRKNPEVLAALLRITI